MLPSQESKAFCFVGIRGVRQGLQFTGVGLEGYSAQNLCFAICCSVCQYVWCKNLGVIYNGILGPKEYPLGICFWPKPFFLEPHESPDAPTVISLRGGSKATGNSRSFVTAFFLKSTTLLSTSPHSSPFRLDHGTTQCSRTRVLNHCAIWPPSPRRVWRRTGSQNLLVLWWAEGTISPAVLGTVAGWTALQVSLG